MQVFYHESDLLLDEPFGISPLEELLVGATYVNRVKNPARRSHEKNEDIGKKRKIQVWIWNDKEDSGSRPHWVACIKPDDIRHPTDNTLRLSLSEHDRPSWVTKQSASRSKNSFQLLPPKKHISGRSRGAGRS